MNHQTAETKLEFALREQERERVEKEKARYHLKKVLAALSKPTDPRDADVQSIKDAIEYLYPSVKKQLYANDDEGRN